MLQLKDWVELAVFVLGLAFQSGVIYGAVKWAMRDFDKRLSRQRRLLRHHAQSINLLQLQNARHFPDEPITIPPGMEGNG